MISSKMICFSLVALAVGVFVQTLAVLAAEEVSEGIHSLVGKQIDLHLNNGKFLSQVEVLKLTPGTDSDALKSLSVRLKQEKKTQSFGAVAIEEIYLDGHPLDVLYDKKTRQLSISEEKRAQRLEQTAIINQRLLRQQRFLWPEVSINEQENHLKRQREHIDEVMKNFSQIPLKLFETNYFLFTTDLPPQIIQGYLKQLDAMYHELCKGFGLPEGRNIWQGKCLIFAFSQKAAFHVYEERYYEEAPPSSTQGLCHSHSLGKVVISLHAGDNPTFFGAVLVHETAHGVIHRFRSNVPIPTWINEGIADWVAGTVVKSDDEVLRRQKEGIARLQQTGRIPATFFEDGAQFDRWHYGVASSLVAFMLKKDARQYREFIIGIKEGATWQESLKTTYKLTPEELVVAYGRSLGIPQLR